MKFNQTEKSQLIIFGCTAFLIPYLFGILMGIGYRMGNDVSIFANVQMYMPAAGVMLAMLITRGQDRRVPRKFYICFLVQTALLAACCVVSVFIPSLLWAVVCQLLIIGGSVVGWIFLLLENKENRAAYGLRLTRCKGKNPVLYVLLFIVLYFGRIVLAGLISVLSGQAQGAAEFGTEEWVIFIVNLAAMPINFFLAFTAFFGEEYGWRGFLQPLLQKRLGSIKGILLLGVLWGIWHLPLNIFYYSPDTWLLSVVNQIVLCVCYSAFFGFAYMKTKTIWVPVVIHYFNNNAVLLFGSAESISNQVLTWGDVLLNAALLIVLYLPFLASKIFRKEMADPIPRTEDF